MLVFRPLKPRARHLRAGALHVVERADRIEAGPLLDAARVADPPGAAVRPVELQPVAHRAAQHLVDRDAESLRLQVHQRVLDRGDRLLRDTADRLARHAVQIGGDLLHRPRIPANQLLAELADHAGEAGRAVPFHELRPADKALVGADLEEREVAPARVAVQVLDLRDAHGRPRASAGMLWSAGRHSNPVREKSEPLTANELQMHSLRVTRLASKPLARAPGVRLPLQRPDRQSCPCRCPCRRLPSERGLRGVRLHRAVRHVLADRAAGA